MGSRIISDLTITASLMQPSVLASAYDAFLSYASVFLPADPRVSLKIAHTLRVARIARRIAVAERLSENDVLLAELIGLLHDIGRFEQLFAYKTLSDEDSENHAVIGTRILFGDDGIIRRFSTDPFHDDTILAAVANHNKLAISDADTLPPSHLTHCRIIRDADKIDNYEVQAGEAFDTLYGHSDIENDILSPALYENFSQQQLCDYSLRNPKSSADSLICTFAYVYDLYFPASHDIVLRDGYLSELGDRRYRDPWTDDKMRECCRKSIEWCRDHSQNFR